MTGVCFCLNRREEKRQSLARCSCFRTPEREREKERARFSPDVGQNFFPFFARVSFRHSSLSISNFTIRDVCSEKCQFSSKNFYKNCTIILINFKNLQDQLYLRLFSLSLIFHLYSLSLSFFYPLQLDKHTRLYSTLFLIRFYFLSFLPFNPFYSQLHKRTIYTTKLTRSRIPSPPFFLYPSLSLSLCILNVLLASPSFFLPLASPRPFPSFLPRVVILSWPSPSDQRRSFCHVFHRRRGGIMNVSPDRRRIVGSFPGCYATNQGLKSTVTSGSRV